MKLAGENVLLRIFVDTFKKWHHVPVYEAIVEKARREHMSGATVLEGIEGFGQTGVFHKDSPWRLANDREVIIEIVDTEEKIEAFLSSIEPMLEGTIATMERAYVVHYRAKEAS